MNIFEEFQGRVAICLGRLAGEFPGLAGADLARVVVEPPRDPGHGDLATNAALALAKEVRANPRELAARLAEELAKDPDISSASVAGPGFINLTLRARILRLLLRRILALGPGFGRSDLGQGEPVNVEYVSANPTGPLHVGHGRGACFGDALANLLNFAGFRVTREYYINDAGGQVDTLARSVHLRYREAFGEAIGAIPEGLYPGEYLRGIGAELAKMHGSALNQLPEERWLPIVREAAIAAMLALIRADLEVIGIRHDVYFSEKSLIMGEKDQIRATIADLRARDLVYEGRLPPPKGSPVEDWEDREQTLFRATAFGDDVDRPLLKSDGNYTYFAADIAYHASKFARGFATMIDVWGADHGGYVTRLTAAVKAISGGKGALDVKLCQMVRVLRNGAPVKLSKRAGEIVQLSDVVSEVGRDAVRFMMLFRKNDAMLDFDLAKVVEQSRENPVFYVQYAHARCRSLFRQAAEAFGGPISPAEVAFSPLESLTDPADLDLIKRLAQFPRVVAQAAEAHEPHRVAFYMHDLAAEFHSHWNRGKDLIHLRFVNQTDRSLSVARLALVQAVETVLKSGLSLLGVSAPEEMR